MPLDGLDAGYGVKLALAYTLCILSKISRGEPTMPDPRIVAIECLNGGASIGTGFIPR